jgi:protoheme IX farnesyltransferase
MFLKFLNIFFKLIRLKLSFAITFSSFAGYIIYKHTFDFTGICTISGVFLMVCAASVLNHYQERGEDAIMERTKNRPLPLKQITPGNVITVSAIFGVLGSCLLIFESGIISALLSIFNMAWYNGIYTPLKKKTSFAVLIGSVTGALPPVIGWTAAGGNIFDVRIIVVAIFMLLWQVPHFWLLLIKYGKEYEQAGFVSVLKVLNETSIKRIIFVWILASTVCSFVFPFYHIISGTLLISNLVLFNVVLVVFFAKRIFSKKMEANFNSNFYWIYVYQAMILILLILDALKNS